MGELWRLLVGLADDVGFERVQMDFGDATHNIDPPVLFTNYPRWFHAEYYLAADMLRHDFVEANVIAGGGPLYYGSEFEADLAEDRADRDMISALEDIGLRSAISIPVAGPDPELEGCVNFGGRDGRGAFLERIEPLASDLALFAMRLHLRGQKLRRGETRTLGAASVQRAALEAQAETVLMERYGRRERLLARSIAILQGLRRAH